MLLVFLFVTFAGFAAVQNGDDRPAEGAAALVKRQIARLWGNVEDPPSQSIVYPRPNFIAPAPFPNEHFVHNTSYSWWSFTDNPDHNVIEHFPSTPSQ